MFGVGRIGRLGSLRAGSASAPWAPSQEAGLGLWLATDSLQLSGADITGWVDKSPAAYLFSPDGTLPDWTDSAAYFDGTTHLSTASHEGALDVGLSDFLFAIRVRFNDLVGSYSIAGMTDNLGVGFNITQDGTGIFGQVADGGGSANVSGDASGLDDGGYYTIIVLRTEGGLYMLLNGVGGAPQDASAINSDSTGTFKIGNIGPTGINFNGYIREVLFFKQTVDQALIDNVQAWMATV